MKHNPTHTRHCEEPQATRQSIYCRLDCFRRRQGYGGQVAALAMTMVGFIMLFVPSQAFACMESVTFQSRIESADIIFEGHLVRYEKQNLFEKPRISLVMVYTVDKNLKGVKEGQEIKILGWNESVENGGELPEPPKEQVDAILVLERKVAETPHAIYAKPMCPNGIFEGPENIKYFQENYRD